MKQTSFSIFILLIIVGLLLPACTPTAKVEEEIKPVHLEPIAGTDLNNVILTADAAKRLDIQMAPVREEEMDGTQRTVIPYAAVLYESNGNTWVYVNTKPLTFMRQAIVIDYIKGDLAVLSNGPSPDTMVVTVGAAELFGSESEFEEE
jgi:hypothetical protein